MSILFGTSGVAFLTDPATGKVTLLAGVPITTLRPPDQALAAAFLTDSDVFPAPAVAAGAVSLSPGLQGGDDAIYPPTAAAGAATLAPALFTDADALYGTDVSAPGASLSILPPLVADVDAFFRPLGDATSPPLHGSTSHLRPQPATDTDTIFPASLVSARLSPALVADADAIFAAAASPSNTLRPALVTDADAIFVPGVVNIRLGLQPSPVASDDVIYQIGVTVFLAPSLVASDDAIGHADVGWRLFADNATTDADLIYGVHVEAFNGLQPAIFVEEDVIDFYPFRIHAIEGGIPVLPDPDTLTGSIHQPRRVLTGSLSNQRKTLTGSLTHSTRTLTGSLRRGSHSGAASRGTRKR